LLSRSGTSNFDQANPAPANISPCSETAKTNSPLPTERPVQPPREKANSYQYFATLGCFLFELTNRSPCIPVLFLAGGVRSEKFNGTVYLLTSTRPLPGNRCRNSPVSKIFFGIIEKNQPKDCSTVLSVFSRICQTSKLPGPGA
jgi:hypothetical protein